MENHTGSKNLCISSNLKGTCVWPLLTLENPQGDRRQVELTLGDTDAGGSHFGEHLLPWKHWYWQEKFWSRPCSLLVLRAYPPTRGLTPVPGPAGHIASSPGTLPHLSESPESASPASRPAPTLGTPRPYWQPLLQPLLTSEPAPWR